MADVFLSYASDDRDRVLPLVRFLEGRGWTVWWDRSLRPGETWPQVIERELNSARCVVVAWSMQSVNSPWVRLEANRARERHNIIPIRLDDASVPPEFGSYQSFDMRGNLDDQALSPLGDGVSAQLRRHWLRRIAIISASLVVGLLLIATTTCVLSDRCGWSIGPEIPKTSFAVVTAPINLADAATNELLEAFVDDVRRNLRRTALGKVSSRAETTALPAGVSPIDLGKRLRVRWLLAVNISGNADHLRVLVELVDTSTGYLSDDWNLQSSITGLNELNATLVRDVLGKFVDDVTNARVATNEPGDAYTRYLEGRAALREGSSQEQLARAQSIFESVLARWPRYAPAEAALCELHLLRFETTRAPEEFAAGERHCTEALAIDPNTAESSVALGQLYLLQGRNDLARRSFERAIAETDTLAAARIGLGDVAQAEGRNKDAERELRLAVDAEPGYWRTYTALGNFLFHQGRGREALAEHRHAAELAQNDGVALNNIGAALYLSGQMEAAIGAWNSALELAAQAPTYSNLGAAYYLLGDYTKAVAMYERSIALVADDYRTWINLADARAFGAIGDAAQAYAKAEQLIQRELEMNQDDDLTRASLALVKAALGDASAAEDQLARALSNGRTDDWQLCLLAAMTEFRLSRPADAQSHVEAAIRAGYPKILIDLDPQLRSPGSA